MAKSLIHELGSAAFNYPGYQRVIYYGRCVRTPYVENELWFITIPTGDSTRTSAAEEVREPDGDHTFLVDKMYATPKTIEEWGRRIAKWREIAHRVFVGPWCEHFECLWKDVPVYSHTLPNGSLVKYGFCRRQLSSTPERRLWFVSFKEDPIGNYPSTFVVDELCTKSDFLNRMGNDHMKWEIICFCRLAGEVQFDDLQTGTLAGGYVRSHTFQLDSPYNFSVEDVQVRIERYEQYLAAQKDEYVRRSRGFFSKLKKWDTLSSDEQAELMRKWTRRAGNKVDEELSHETDQISFNRRDHF